MHTVSVIMSVYNGERFLREAVESILNQTFTDFEFIIVNDGSTDGTLEILESYRDERIILINQDNMGLTKALNNGFALAKGKYVARQDADDLSKPTRLEKQVAFMEDNQAVGLLSTRFEFIDQDGQVTGPCYVVLDNKLLQARLIDINQFCHGAAMIRKEALLEVGAFREFFKYAQDHDLWLRIAEKYELANLPDFLFQYRDLESAISSRKILLQSQFAEVAMEMAKQRRRTGIDAIQQGIDPILPPARQLARSLQRKLTDFYSRKPSEMLNSLQVAGESSEDLFFLFRNLCSEKLQAEAELRKKSGELDSEKQSVQKLNERVQASDTRHTKELQQKDGQLSFQVDQLRHKDEQFSFQAEQLRRKDEQSSFQLEQLRGKDDQLSFQVEQLRGKDEQISSQLERLRLNDELISSQTEQLHRRDEQISLREEQLRRKDAEFIDLADKLSRANNEIEVRVGELKNLTESSSAEHQRLVMLLNEKDRRIEDLLKSMSWKVTSPLRAAFGFLIKK